MPRVSVVIPAHNARSFIRAALLSVRAQTLGDWEILLVDDGSSDGTLEEARASGVPLRCLRQERRGPGAARNRGVSQAAGEYVAFLDADDSFQPRKLELQARALDEEAQWGAVYTDVSIVEAGRSPQRKSDSVALPSGWIAEEILRDPRIIITSTLMFRRRLWEGTGPFDEGSPIAEDWEWFVRLACRAPILALPEALVDYRLHAANTHRNLDANAAHGLRMLRRALDAYAAAGRRVSAGLRRDVLHEYYRSYGAGYLFSGRGWRAAPYFLRALALRPAQARGYLYLAASLVPPAALRRIQRLRGRAV